MKPEEQQKFKELLQSFLNDELSESDWNDFDELLKNNKEARDAYRQAMSMEVDLEDIYKKNPDNLTPIIPVESNTNSISTSKSNRWVLVAALILFAIIPFMFLEIKFPRNKSKIPEYVTQESFAIITENKAIFKDLSDHKIETYRLVGREKIAFKSGHLRLEYFNGAIVELKGPCEYYVQSADRSFLNKGTVSARITPESQGFKIFSPGVSLVDLGTEFSLKVDDEQQTHVHVFEGEAEVSLLNQRGETVRSESVFGKEKLSLNPKSQTISHDINPFEPFRIKRTALKALPFRDHIMKVARSENPSYQWGLESISESTWIQKIQKNLDIKTLPNAEEKFPTYLSSTPLTEFNKEEFSVEFWFNANSIHRASLFSLLKAKPEHTVEKFEDIKNLHFLYVELESDAKDAMHRGGCVRYLLRSPSSAGGGVNLFSQKNYIPGAWHHVVVTKDQNKMELYLDGILQASYKVNFKDNDEKYYAYMGALSPSQLGQRNFNGTLDGVAIYPKKLTDKQVKLHFMARYPGS